jgi:exodeoxyribonuclease-3
MCQQEPKTPRIATFSDSPLSPALFQASFGLPHSDFVISVMKLTTWNVNGIRASLNKGLREYLTAGDADVICLQETKAQQEQVDLSLVQRLQRRLEQRREERLFRHAHPQPCARSKRPRWVSASPSTTAKAASSPSSSPTSIVVNVYTPNSQAELARLSYRLHWDDAYRAHLKKLEKTKPVIACGDLNCAHQEIDLANPKSNRMNPGFSDEERASFTRHLDAGFLDVFRQFDPNPGRYTWWTQRTPDARAKNIGWRLDYWLASEKLKPALKSMHHPR